MDVPPGRVVVVVENLFKSDVVVAIMKYVENQNEENFIRETAYW